MTDTDDLSEAGGGEAMPSLPLRSRGASAPVRSTARAETRPEGQREQVRTRTRQRLGTVDKFHIDPAKIPAGMSYEWKRYEVLGQQDHSYMQAQAENAWEPVDCARHPELMPPGHKGSIIRDGLMLMERPIELTMEARDEDRLIARQQVRAKEQQLGQTPDGQFTRDHATARPRVSKSYEPMPIPND